MLLEEKTIESMRVAGMRHVGPYPEIGATWQKFMVWMKGQNFTDENMKVLSVYHDDPRQVPQDQLRSDAAVSVGSDFESNSEAISIFTIPGGKYITTIHKGSYEKLGEVWANMGAAIQEKNLKPGAQMCLEIYLNDPTTVAADECLTELYVPLEV